MDDKNCHAKARREFHDGFSLRDAKRAWPACAARYRLYADRLAIAHTLTLLAFYPRMEKAEIYSQKIRGKQLIA